MFVKRNWSRRGVNVKESRHSTHDALYWFWRNWSIVLTKMFARIIHNHNWWWLLGSHKSKFRIRYEQNRGNWMAKTSWSLLEVASRLIALAAVLLLFLPNLWYELALSMSFSVVLLIGIVPSGHVSPPFVHSWKLSGEKPDMGRWPFGRSGGSWTQHIEK